MKKVTVLRALSLAVACVTHIFWGSVTTATYYTNALKVQYNFSQSQVELLLPILTFGKVLSPIPAAVFQRWGAGPTSVAGIVMASGGYALVWMSTCHKAFHQQYIIFIYTYFFSLGLGSAFMNLSMLAVVTANFSDKHRGKAVSVLETSYGSSPLLSLLVYRCWFSEGSLQDDSQQDLAGFMLYSALSSLIVGVLCVQFVRIFKDPEPCNTPLIHGVSTRSCDKDAPRVAENKQPRWWRRVAAEISYFAQWPTQLLIWSFALTYSVYVGLDYNLAVYAKAAGLYSVFDSSFVTFHVALFTSRLLVGFILDALADVVPKMTYSVVSAFFLALALGVGTVLPTSIASLYLIAVAGGIAGGVMRPVFVTVIAKELGEEQFAKNWGITYCVASALLTCWLMAFGALFEAGIPPGEKECFGEQCLKWGNLLASIMMMVSTLFSLILTLKKRF